jgi:hypothetical protein
MNQLQRNKTSMNTTIDQVVKQYSKVLSIRVDLHFMSDSLSKNNIHDLQSNVQKFIKAVNNSKDLKDYVAYFRAFELGDTKGVHCHCLFMYDGQKRQSDSWIGMQLGELWKRVTKGEGGYYNSNCTESKKRIRKSQTKQKYQDKLLEVCQIPSVADDIYQETQLGLASNEFSTLGIGMLKRNDTVGWFNVRGLSNYFTKAEQSFSNEERAGVRLFSQSSRLRKRKSNVRQRFSARQTPSL